MSMAMIVKGRLKEVCPNQTINEMDIIEVEKACNVAFKIIGYEVKNLEKSVQKVWETSEGDTCLCDFVFDVWGEDDD